MFFHRYLKFFFSDNLWISNSGSFLLFGRTLLCEVHDDLDDVSFLGFNRTPGYLETISLHRPEHDENTTLQDLLKNVAVGGEQETYHLRQF